MPSSVESFLAVSYSRIFVELMLLVNSILLLSLSQASNSSQRNTILLISFGPSGEIRVANRMQATYVSRENIKSGNESPFQKGTNKLLEIKSTLHLVNFP